MYNKHAKKIWYNQLRISKALQYFSKKLKILLTEDSFFFKKSLTSYFLWSVCWIRVSLRCGFHQKVSLIRGNTVLLQKRLIMQALSLALPLNFKFTRSANLEFRIESLCGVPFLNFEWNRACFAFANEIACVALKSRSHFLFPIPWRRRKKVTDIRLNSTDFYWLSLLPSARLHYLFCLAASTKTRQETYRVLEPQKMEFWVCLADFFLSWVRRGSWLGVQLERTTDESPQRIKREERRCSLIGWSLWQLALFHSFS